MRNSKPNNKGFSILEGIIAAGVVAASILAIGVIVGRHSDLSKRAEAKQELPGVSTDVLNRTKSVLVDTKNAAGRSTEGLCRLLVPEEIRPGIVPINVNLKGIIATPEKWRAAFLPDWTVVSVTNNTATVSLQLKPTSSNTLVNSRSIDVESLSVNVLVQPRTIDPTGQAKVFSAIPSSTAMMDAKRVIFTIEEVTKFVQIQGDQRIPKEAEAKELISVLDISCEVLAGTDYLPLSPAGTGVGDPDGKTIYNDTDYEEKERNAFEFTMAKTEVTRGTYNATRKTLSADPTGNAVSSCTELTYRCPKDRGARNYRPYINMATNINYHPSNRYSTRKINPVRVIPEMELEDSIGRNLLAGREGSINYSSGAGVNYTKGADGLYYTVDNGVRVPLEVGDHQSRILATVSDAQPLCRQVCDGGQAPSISAVLKLTTPDLTDPKTQQWVQETGKAAGAFSCTMCFVKSCSRVGIKTFGPVAQMPPEPLDSQIPECSAQNDQEARKFLPFTGTPVENLNQDSKCISARVVDKKLVYKARSCSDLLPVMCFAYGEYTLARTLTSPTPTGHGFNVAPEACRQMGSERQNVSALKAVFAQQGGNPAGLDGIPTIGADYVFLNLAKQGSFIAPQAKEDQDYAVDNLTNEERGFPHARNGGEFWVALKTESGAVVSHVPQALYTAVDQHLVYFNGAGTISYSRINDMPYNHVANSPSSDVAYVLFNHVRFRGVVPTARTQSALTEFLCMKKSDKSFFISSTGHKNFNQGGNVCEAEQGIFVAPSSPLGWLQAMMLVDKHLPFAPFPGLVSNPRRVWVALTDGLMPELQGELSKLAEPSTTSSPASTRHVYADGSFIKRSMELKTIPKPPPAEDEVIEDPNLKVKIACFNGKTNVIGLYKKGPGCPVEQKRILKADMKKPIYSLIWVLSKSQFDLDNDEYIEVSL